MRRLAMLDYHGRLISYEEFKERAIKTERVSHSELRPATQTVDNAEPHKNRFRQI